MTELAQCADKLLDQQHGEVEVLHISPTRFHGREKPRRGAAVASIAKINNSIIDNLSKSEEKKDYSLNQRNKAVSSGQFKHCGLCLTKNHNMDKCKFASKELATKRKTNL